MPLQAVTMCLPSKVKEKSLRGKHGTSVLEISDVFTKFTRYPTVINNNDLDLLEMFVVALYDRSSPVRRVNNARLDLFARKQRSFDAIPPTRAALIEHTRRAVYQASCIWEQALTCGTEDISPADWGWKLKDNIWEVVWAKLPPIGESCQQLTKCGWKLDCRGRCKCFGLRLLCTALCSCNCDG